MYSLAKKGQQFIVAKSGKGCFFVSHFIGGNTLAFPLDTASMCALILPYFLQCKKGKKYLKLTMTELEQKLGYS